MNYRRQDALERRNLASKLAHDRPHPRQISNGDEQRFRHQSNCKKNGMPSYLMSFTKGLPHDDVTGLVVDPNYFQLFIRGIDSGDFRDFRDTPLGFEKNIDHIGKCKVPAGGWKSDKVKDSPEPVKIRAWESQSAGLSFDLEGPDAQALTMPPAPKLGSAELTAEMAEVYAQALLRDVPFHAFSAGVFDKNNEKPFDKTKLKDLQTNTKSVKSVQNITDKLNGLPWFDSSPLALNLEEQIRRRTGLNPSNAFRGITPGDDIGPYLSQFLLAGNRGINKNDKRRSTDRGLISYGAMTASQQVRTAKKVDYMTKWNEWLDVQNGADLRGKEEYLNSPYDRFIFTPRDLSTYVHYDALYQAYLNACLIMLGLEIPLDPGIPFQEPDNRDHQQGFAHFGGPHILSLVTEVATRALKAVRFQKFNVHRRCRPEVLAARIWKADKFKEMAPQLAQMKTELGDKGIDLLSDIRKHNLALGEETELLPMAFCEGSPMHPSYGAGHATVAGACVTILKAFFDHGHPLAIAQMDDGSLSSKDAYVSIQNGNRLERVPVFDQDRNPAQLTVEGELNKLASNISIGRDWAGVHYFTDYYESLLMGEQIAIGILEEQKLTYGENFSMTVPLFNGNAIRI